MLNIKGFSQRVTGAAQAPGVLPGIFIPALWGSLGPGRWPNPGLRSLRELDPGYLISPHSGLAAKGNLPLAIVNDNAPKPSRGGPVEFAY
jgi:hypothetical protein